MSQRTIRTVSDTNTKFKSASYYPYESHKYTELQK